MTRRPPSLDLIFLGICMTALVLISFAEARGDPGAADPPAVLSGSAHTFGWCHDPGGPDWYEVELHPVGHGEVPTLLAEVPGPGGGSVLDWTYVDEIRVAIGLCFQVRVRSVGGPCDECLSEPSEVACQSADLDRSGRVGTGDFLATLREGRGMGDFLRLVGSLGWSVEETVERRVPECRE